MIIRVADRQHYTRVDNRAINDDRLSLKALGLLAYLLSKPDDWRIERDQLSESHVDGVRSVRTALAELADAGYLVRERSRRADGTWDTVSTIYENPPDLGAKRASGVTCDDAPDLGAFSAGGKRASVVTTVDQETIPVEANASPGRRSANGRQRDLVFEALAEACDIDMAELTKPARGALNAATRELRLLDATAEDIHRRAGAYRAKMPDVAITPSALVKWWPTFSAAKQAGGKVTCQACGVRAFPDADGWSCPSPWETCPFVAAGVGS